MKFFRVVLLHFKELLVNVAVESTVKEMYYMITVIYIYIYIYAF